MSKCDICHSSDDWCDHCGTCHKCLGEQIDKDKNKISELLKEIEQRDKVIEAAKEFGETLQINKNEPPVPVAGKLNALMEALSQLEEDV